MELSKKDFTYNFRTDPLMQEIGTKLFSSGERVVLSRGSSNKKLVSISIYGDDKSQYANERRTNSNFTITYYTELDHFEDYYNIIILIEQNNRRDNTYYTIKVPGSSPEEQNNLIEFILNKHSTEIWLATQADTFIGVQRPVFERFETREQLKEVYDYNEMDMRECKMCGKKFSSMYEQNYCSDCIAKMIVEDHRS